MTGILAKIRPDFQITNAAWLPAGEPPLKTRDLQIYLLHLAHPMEEEYLYEYENLGEARGRIEYFLEGAYFRQDSKLVLMCISDRSFVSSSI
jgi:hypothetical protein